ncbi:MAG: hypothetical protein JNN15_10545, partial [Blastocatellia bacterium]|nr:hypothetical protein [Blastocatellia bacterium]
REGKWKCTYCDAVNLGRELKCGSCTATRDKDVKFIYDEDAPEVTDTSLLERATGGAEWLCETCGCSNVSNRQECKQCGAPKGGSKSRDVKM